jgi:hypothetical protein
MIVRRLLSGVTTLLCCLSPLSATAQPAPTGILDVPPAESPHASPSPAPAPPATTPLAWQQRPASLAAAPVPAPAPLDFTPPPPVKSEWTSTYSGHIVLADMAWVSTAFAGVKVESGQLLVLGGLGYFVVAPAVHLALHRPKTALASVILRVGLPVVAAFLGAGIATALAPPDRCDPLRGPCSEYGPEVGGFIIGGLTGFVAAPILDASVLARVNWFDKPRSESAAQAMPTPTTFRFTGTF